MAKPCPSCNKFPSLEIGEPDIQSSPEIDESGHVSASVRIVLTSGCCGDEIKEYTFDLESECPEAEDHLGEGHELSVEECGDPEVTERQETEKDGKRIPARYQRRFYGVTWDCEVHCTCIEDKSPIATVTLDDDIQASYMEEL